MLDEPDRDSHKAGKESKPDAFDDGQHGDKKKSKSRKRSDEGGVKKTGRAADVWER